MILVQLLWGSVLLIGVHHKYAKNSHFKNFESALYLTSMSMPLIESIKQKQKLLVLLKFLLFTILITKIKRLIGNDFHLLQFGVIRESCLRS